MGFLYDTHFWEAVAFILAVALVWKKASGAITGALDERARKIREEARRGAQAPRGSAGDPRQLPEEAARRPQGGGGDHRARQGRSRAARRPGGARSRGGDPAPPAPRRGKDRPGRAEGPRRGPRRRRRRRGGGRPTRPRRGHGSARQQADRRGDRQPAATAPLIPHQDLDTKGRLRPPFSSPATVELAAGRRVG